MNKHWDEQTAGCGCQYDAAGSVFVDRCVCASAQVDWPARFRKAASAAERVHLPATARYLREVAMNLELTPPDQVEAIARALLGQVVMDVNEALLGQES